MVGLVTDIGLKRSLNEDSAAYVENEYFKLYVVADGMGGHNAGEVASKMATTEILNYVQNNFKSESNEDLLIEAIGKANECIYEYSKTNKNLNGMGTTVTACLITKDYEQVANVGDSCCFGISISNKEMKKITKDHSLVQELVDSGSISESEAVNHPKKNIITRALGTKHRVSVDIFPIKNRIYDMYLLCSDGLTNELTRDEILEIILQENEYNSVANKLVEKAKLNGGRDNITVLLFGGEM